MRLHSLADVFRRFRWPLGATLALLLVGLALGLWWRAGSERRALSEMPAEQRRELYLQTLRSAELLCAPPPSDDALHARCESLTQFLVAFPECDAGCEQLAMSLRRQPTK